MKPKFTKPLRDFLKLRGFDVIQPVTDSSGQEQAPVVSKAGLYVVDELVLLRSTFGKHPPSVDMQIQAILIDPNQSRTKLGPYVLKRQLSGGEVENGSITSEGLSAVWSDLLLPLVNDIERLTP